MTQPFVAAGPNSTTQLNSLVPNADGILAKRDIWSKVFTNFSSSAIMKDGFAADLQRMGKEVMTNTLNIYHAERGDIFAYATIATMTFVSGQNFLITFTTGSATAIGGVYSTPGVRDDIILARDGKTRVRIVTKTDPAGSTAGHTALVSADDSTDVSSGGLQDAFAAKFTSGNARCAFVDSVASEFGQFSTGQYQTYDIYKCQFQKLRDQIPLVSMEAAGQEMEVSLSNGTSCEVLDLTLGDMMERFWVKKSLSLLTGNGKTYTDQVTGLPAIETQGLTALALANGGSTVIPYATAYTEATLQTLIRYFNAQAMGDEIVGYLGQEAYFKFQTLLGSLSNSAAIRFDSFGDDKKAADFGFRSFFYGGKTFHLKASPEFQDPNLLDLGSLAANYWPNSSVWSSFGKFGGGDTAKDKTLGTFGSKGMKSVINTYVYGQKTRGADPSAKVKTQMVYQDAAINDTEGSKVIMSQMYTLQYQGSKKLYMIEGS